MICKPVHSCILCRCVWCGIKNSVSISFSLPCSMHIIIINKKSHHELQISYLEFTNDVIRKLLQGNRNSEHSDLSDLDKAPHENVLHSTGRHFPTKISICGTKKKVMKRCRVCYKKNIRRESRYTSDQSPFKPGLCRQLLWILSFKKDILGTNKRIHKYHIY